MPVGTPDQVVKLLAQGKTVAFVMDATSWPRRSILGLAAKHRLLHDPDTDRVARPPDKAPTAMGEANHARWCVKEGRQRSDCRICHPVNDNLADLADPKTDLAVVTDPPPAPARTRVPDADDVPVTLRADAPLPPPREPGRCSHAQLLHWAADHPSKRIQAAGRRATEAMDLLIRVHHDEIEAERARRAEEEARAKLAAEVAELERQLAEKRALLKGGRPPKTPTAPAGAPAKPTLAAADGERRATDGKRLPKPPDYPWKEVRAWAKANGISVPEHGRYLPTDVVAAWRQMTQSRAS